MPFPPLRGSLPGDLVAHALADRRVGVLLVRLGGYAAGVFDGDRLVASKVGSRQVHGRSAAGGRSQQRFARRREGQVRVGAGRRGRHRGGRAAARRCPHWTPSCSAATGGPVDEVLADPRLAPLRPLVGRPGWTCRTRA